MCLAFFVAVHVMCVTCAKCAVCFGACWDAWRVGVVSCLGALCGVTAGTVPAGVVFVGGVLLWLVRTLVRTADSGLSAKSCLALSARCELPGC